MNERVNATLCVCALVIGALFVLAPPAYSQNKATLILNHNKATLILNPKSGNKELKTISSQDLKTEISYAAIRGDLTPHDAAALLAKVTDAETLMDQFDFIRTQERNMVTSMGSMCR